MRRWQTGMQRGQPSTCVRHKDLSCLTTGCSVRHVALVTKKKKTLFQREPPSSPGNVVGGWGLDTEGRRKVLSKTGRRQKWLPLSKGRGCTHSSWIPRCLLRDSTAPGRGQTGRKDKRAEERDEAGRTTEGKLLRCRARERTGGSLRFQMSVVWNCTFQTRTIWPPACVQLSPPHPSLFIPL